MSDMDDFVDVIVSRGGKQVLTGCYKLPVSVGRGEHNAIRIGHDPQDKTVSRTHAIIQRDGKGLRLLDKSANGTIYRGARIKQIVNLGTTDHFEIFDFDITVAKARHDPSIPTIFEAHVLVDGYMKGNPLQIGEMMLLCFRRGKGYRFEQIPVRANFESIWPNYRIDDEHAFAAIVSDHGAGHLVTAEGDKRSAILLNKQPVPESSVVLHPRDVIEIKNIRIELYPPGENSLKCSNPACQLLNPYILTSNCRFCSFGLVGAVTRAASPPVKSDS
jgi:FHA domain-containing protein